MRSFDIANLPKIGQSCEEFGDDILSVSMGQESKVGIDATDKVLQLPEVLQGYAARLEDLGAELLCGIEGVV